jgi:peptide/nickel transport system substrate-binding protein
LFTSEFVPPLPRHVLDSQYRQNKANWEILTYWTTDFIGTGPFAVGDWEPGSHVRLQAFDQYLLGRPRVDVIDVRFIPDANALVASVLAGGIDVTLGRSISVEQAAEVERWPDGRAQVTPYNLIRAFWQALTPDPAVIGNVQARRALLQAVNREELAANLQGGLAPAAYSVLYPGAFPEIEAGLPRYSYDARAAVAQLEALGYRPGTDGMLRDAEAQPLTIDITANFQDFNQKPALAMADYWKKVGVASTVTIVPTQLQGTEKLRYEAERPGFTVIRGNPAPQNFEDYHSSHARLADKGYNGSNRGRYMRAELDALLETYKVTIPQTERNQVLAQIMQHLSEQVVQLPLLYGAEPAIIANRLVNVGPRPTAASGNGNPAWNAHEWDVKS